MTYARICEVRPRKDRRGVNLISDVLPLGSLWYGEPDAVSNPIGDAKFYTNPEPKLYGAYNLDASPKA